jgi:hypothetical protein
MLTICAGEGRRPPVEAGSKIAREEKQTYETVAKTVRHSKMTGTGCMKLKSSLFRKNLTCGMRPLLPEL